MEQKLCFIHIVVGWPMGMGESLAFFLTKIILGGKTEKIE